MIDFTALQWLWWPALFIWPLAFASKFLNADSGHQQALFLNKENSLRLSSSNETTKAQSNILWWFIWSLLILAAMRPTYLSEPIEIPQEARQLILAVDVSGSMRERDMIIQGKRYRRLEALQYVLSDFVKRRKGDELGLILFGSQAYLQAPMTADTRAIEKFLFQAEIGIAGNATAIGDAIGLALLQLRESDSPEKIMVLATDGENTAGEVDPLVAAQTASKEIKIYTIGIGEADSKTLSTIATTTGGQYFHARSSEELASIYKQIDKLEPIAVQTEKFQVYRELFHFPLILAAFLILSSKLIRGVRYATGI